MVQLFQNSFPVNICVDTILSDISDPTLDLDISLNELIYALNKWKRNKSPSYDGVANEFLMALPDN